jgi:broad specificity phosphatase PhoE
VTRRLLLVRHGVTTWNREGRFQGHLDPPLDPSGEEEAAHLAQRLVAEEPAPMRIVSSPLQRAAATAGILARALAAAGRAAELVTDARLMEIGQGEWEGHTHVELEQSDPAGYAAWREGGGIIQPPGAETVVAALSRVSTAIDQLVAEAASPLCLVSHGGILRLAAGHLLGLEARRAWSLDVDNASLSRLAREADDGAWRIDAWNDTGHLLGRTALHLDEVEGEPLAL